MYGMDIRVSQQIDPNDAKYQSLPIDYPTPSDNGNLLFYIQRNHNKNTVLYDINYLADGSINSHDPMHVFWLRYDDSGEAKELNYMQDALVYGYHAESINHESYSFRFVASKEKQFYIAKMPSGRYRTLTKINGEMSILSNIYVYAEDFGVFPIIKSVEFFGKTMDGLNTVYEKVLS